MASVWVARERSAVSGKQRFVAVKAMLPELAARSQFRSMFLGEVQIIQAINHENVVRVFEVSEDRGTLYMAMEWVEGDSLRNIIKAAKARGALPAEIAVRIAADAAAGLHAAHELRDWDGELRGVVHCDVSPHNVLVGVDGKAKLVDFGIANALGRLEPDGEKIKGKLSYMSPEQTRGARVDRRTDIFALGIVLFEMTTGEQLFKGRDAAHTLELVRVGAIPQPSTLNPKYPPLLEAIVMRALDRDPDRRFQTAAEFEQALTGYLYAERILVSHAAVAQLLVRVTGQRLEKRREYIARVAQALDGEIPSGEVGANQLAALADLAPMQHDPFNYTLTNAMNDAALGVAARLESTTMVAHELARPVPEEPVLIEPDARTFSWLWAVAAGAVLLIGSIIAYVMWGTGPSAADLAALGSSGTSALPSASQAASNASKRSADVLHEHVQSAESLPVATDSTRRTGAPRRVTRRVGGKEMVIDLDSDPGKSATGSSDSSDSSDSSSNSAASQTNAAETQGEGINRGAANAALANAAAAAKACRSHGDSPTGPGRAAVTFAPDGSAAAVSLSQRFNGTSIGNCVVAYFKQVHAPPFSGEPTTLFYQFDIP
jgi:serine/threonine-protein kinase